MMNWKAYARAQAEVALANKKFQEMKSTHDLSVLSARWSEFLILTQRVFTKMRIATQDDAAGKYWFKNILALQEKDELPKYVKTTRDFDEHGIDQVTTNRPGGVGIKGKPGIDLHIDYMQINRGNILMGPEAHRTTTVEFIPESIELELRYIHPKYTWTRS
jgi:hypothetical protein